ncbi:MAG: hypothetical protein O3A00_25110, partial [Planctomycetota bacterium]|nr:hypothetical protein [Planctomycetota bacterium]
TRAFHTHLALNETAQKHGPIARSRRQNQFKSGLTETSTVNIVEGGDPSRGMAYQSITGPDVAVES